MTHEEMLALDPKVAETTAKALKHVVEFNKGRGAMLASLRDPNAAQVARIFHQLNKDHSRCQ